LPFYGIMQFDTADLLALENNFTIEAVILHEMGHVLGIGTIWNALGLISNPLTLDPRFTGPQATAAYNQIFGRNEPGVPVENFLAGPGSGLSHWRESGPGGLVNELMTPFIGPRFLAPIYLPLSRITAASLADLGYQVDISKADLYFPLTGVQYLSAFTASVSGSTSGSPLAAGLAAPVEQAGVGSPTPRTVAAISASPSPWTPHAQLTDILFAEGAFFAEDDLAALDLLTAPISVSPHDILAAALAP
jgi:hypothetical protein